MSKVNRLQILLIIISKQHIVSEWTSLQLFHYNMLTVTHKCSLSDCRQTSYELWLSYIVSLRFKFKW